MAKLVYFFCAKAFLILAIIIIKIIYFNFLASCASGVTLIIWIFKVLSELRLSLVSYMVFYLILSLVLSIGLISSLGLGFLSIPFIVKY